MVKRKTTRRFIRFLSLGILFSWVMIPSMTMAGEDSLSFVSILKYGGGILTGAMIHEGSHAAVAGLTGTHMNWESGTYNQPIGFTEKADSNVKGLFLYSAGFVSQAVGGEIILDCDKIDKNDAFVRGMMTWNLLNPILYSLDYWFFRSSNKQKGNTYQGDLEGIEHYSNERTANAFALSFSAIAVYQGYRFLKTQSWAPEWMKGEKNRFTLAPVPSGGFIVGYHFSF
jgi:hypothetical protein